MKEIKNIWCSPSHADDFDNTVNCYLRDGFVIEKIDIIPQTQGNKTIMLYALLVKES